MIISAVIPRSATGTELAIHSSRYARGMGELIPQVVPRAVTGQELIGRGVRGLGAIHPRARHRRMNGMGDGFDWGTVFQTITTDAANFGTMLGISKIQQSNLQAQANAPYNAQLNYLQQLAKLQGTTAGAAATAASSQWISGVSNSTVLLIGGAALLLVLLK